MISTRGRYSVRILLDLAENSKNSSLVPMKDVSKRQSVSLKYIERIMPALKEGGLVESNPGTNGGYRLARTPDRITLWDILILAEGELAPVSCLQKGAAVCDRASECPTLPVWADYYRLTKNYFSSITLADLMNGYGSLQANGGKTDGW